MNPVEQRVLQLEAEGALSGVHGLVVRQAGVLVYERYWPGEDWIWNTPLGLVHYGPDVTHDLRSVTKSILALGYGIALDQGLVPPPEAKLYDFFPEAGALGKEPQRRALTIEHLLTMSLGLEWNEEVPYDSPANSEIAAEMAQDRWDYILKRPVAEEPGQRWRYGGNNTHLLAKLIAKGCGGDFAAYLAERLFQPLCIEKVEWLKGRDGWPSPASGLRLRPRDLALIGDLVLAGGVWQGKQLVSKTWLERSFQPRFDAWPPHRYGYHWFLSQQGGAKVIAAMGYGGQRLYLVPEKQLSLAVLAGNYAKEDQWLPPLRLFREAVLGLPRFAMTPKPL